MKRLFLISILWFAFTGCSGPKEEDTSVAYTVEATPQPEDQNKTTDIVDNEKPPSSPNEEAAVEASAAVVERKFIKTGRIEFETHDADATRKTIMASM
jgi:PBP1b-binding outer membrane lipoprotein LpoB